MARIWKSIEERATAYDKVLKCMKENGITLDEAFELQGFDPEDRLNESQLLTFTIQKEMASEFLPGQSSKKKKSGSNLLSLLKIPKNSTI